jgi:hypothetical protein
MRHLKTLFLGMSLLFVCHWAAAQGVPPGINYQAVARDAKGAALVNHAISLKISLLADEASGKSVYEEIHRLRTNELGLFSLVIGQGAAAGGDFSRVPWSEHQIWMEIALDETGGDLFHSVSATQLMAVPYAFHAGSAGTVYYEQEEAEKRRCSATGIPFWGNLGNYNVNDTCHFIGTTVPVDFIFKTDAVERMRLTKDGELIILATVTFQDNVTFNGDSVNIANDLFVGGNVDIGEDLNVDGNGTIGVDLSVGNDVQIQNDLNVGNNVSIVNNLDVEGNSRFNNRVVIDATVDGSQSLQSSYPVLIKGSEQGLAIQVNRASDNPLVSGRGNNYVSFWTDENTMTGRIEGMSKADLDPTGLLGIVSSIISNPPTTLNMNPASVLQLPSLNLFSGSAITGIDFSALSFSSNPFINGGNLIFNTSAFNPGNFSSLVTSSLGNASSPFLNTFNGSATVATPASALWGVIQGIVCDPNTGVFTQVGVDPEAATNLKSQIFSNYTLGVLQGGISTLGSVIQLIASFASILDPEDVIGTTVGVATDITNLVIYGSYADINLGVAYESGSGDYAEWLERSNPDEIIYPGDVVGVIGGKVSKKFNHPERFMAVSTAPIVLGNMPADKSREKDHEKIAFMGQVPVKVKGEVKIGDYILPSGEGDGLAIAVSPEHMKMKDYQRIVGVAWAASTPGKFINYINTAVGLNQNDFSRVIEDMQVRMNDMQLAIAEINPNYKPNLYNTNGHYTAASSIDYSVSATHSSVVNTYFDKKEYASQRELLDDVKIKLKERSGFDVKEIPLIDYLFENPEHAPELSEYFENMRSQFTQVYAGIRAQMKD